VPLAVVEVGPPHTQPGGSRYKPFNPRSTIRNRQGSGLPVVTGAGTVIGMRRKLAGLLERRKEMDRGLAADYYLGVPTRIL
jgi:hypothetical protein